MAEPASDSEVFAGGFDEVGGQSKTVVGFGRAEKEMEVTLYAFQNSHWV